MLAGDLDGDGATVVAARRGSGFTVDLERDDRADLTVARGRSDADLLDPR